MKKILYVASSYGHLKSFHVPYITELMTRGYDVELAAGGDATAVKQAVEIELCNRSNTHIKSEVKNTTIKTYAIPFEKKMLSPKNLTCMWKLRKTIKEKNYDMISVHTSLAAFFVRLAVMLAYPSVMFRKDQKAKVKKEKHVPRVINTVHGYLFDEQSPKLKKMILLWAEKITRCVTDTIVVMNEQDYQIAQRYKLYRIDLVKIPGYGINCERFAKPGAGTNGKETTKRQMQINDETVKIIEENEKNAKGKKYVLIYAAEFSKRKNQVFLIKAMKKLPSNVKLQLAGKGEMLDECKALANQLGLYSGAIELQTEGVNNACDGQGKKDRVEFLGHVSNLEEYYWNADVCVSSSRSEGLPFNIMEAMAAGLPVVASRVKGHEDLIEEGVNGCLYDFDDEEGFLRAIAQSIKDMEHVANKEERHKKIMYMAKKYELDNVKEAVLSVYNRFH